MTLWSEYGFASKDDLIQAFEPDAEGLAQINRCDLVYVYLEDGDCESYAWIVFIDRGEIWEVNGSHCSCFGFETQWDPERTSKDALRMRLTDGAPQLPADFRAKALSELARRKRG